MSELLLLLHGLNEGDGDFWLGIGPVTGSQHGTSKARRQKASLALLALALLHKGNRGLLLGAHRVFSDD